MNLTPKRVSVLRELAWLSDEAPAWARVVDDGWWLPYHVVFFRGQGRGVRGAAGAPSFAYGMSVDAAASHLRRLAKDGLAAKHVVPGMRSEYRITDAGRGALAEWDRSHLAD